MSFVMLTSKCKQKVRCLNDNGEEIYDDVDPYAFLRYQEAGLLRPAKKPKRLGTESEPANDGDADDEDDAEKADPEKAISKLNAALDELNVMVDLIDNVVGLKTIMVQYVNNPRSKLDRIRDKAIQVESRKMHLVNAAARFRTAQTQLRAAVKRDNAFISELSQLQKFWRFRRNTHNATTPFSVELLFPNSDGVDLPSEGWVTGGAGHAPRGKIERLNVMQGLDGQVVIGAEKNPATPSVLGQAEGSAMGSGPGATIASGAQDVHSLLKERVHALFWTTIHNLTHWELNQAPHSLFTRPLMLKTLDILSQPDSTSTLTLFRPIVKGLMLALMVPETPPSLRGALAPRALDKLLLLQSIFGYLEQLYFRCTMLRSLDQQVIGYPGTKVSLLSTGNSNVNAALVDGQSRGVLTVCCHSRHHISVHAMPHSWSPVHISRNVSEHLLPHISLGELSGLLERYWGQPDRL